MVQSWRVNKRRSMCVHSVAALGLMPTGRNADHLKRQYVAAMPTRAIRLTITWQRDMVVNPVGRHSGRSAFRHRSDIAAIYEHLYIDISINIRTSITAVLWSRRSVVSRGQTARKSSRPSSVYQHSATVATITVVSTNTGLFGRRDIGGSLDVVAADVQKIITEGQAMGLCLNNTKCEIIAHQ